MPTPKTFSAADCLSIGKNLLGGLGDLGTFVPLFMAMAALGLVSPAPTLFVFGAAYVVSALYFRAPVPVQPLKTVAALALVSGSSPAVIRAAALLMGVFLLSIAASGRVRKWEKFFPPDIIRGIQLGAGLLLMKAGLLLILSASPDPVPSGAGRPFGFPALADFAEALWRFVLPQIPLTLGNSLFAVEDLAPRYFRERARRVTSHALGVSLGFWNLVAGISGAFPLCHGSGGLTAHYRFGARTALATFSTGAVFLGAAVYSVGRGGFLFSAVPPWIWGGMLVYVGIHHALLLRFSRGSKISPLLMGLVGLGAGHLGYALVFGWIVTRSLRKLPHPPLRAVLSFYPWSVRRRQY